MTIIRGAGESDRTVVMLRAAAQDSALSYRARGLLVALMSRPPDWRTDYRRLAAEGREGQRAVRMALGELEQRGYLSRVLVREGRELKYQWAISDRPGLARQTTGPGLQKRRPQRVEPADVDTTYSQPPSLQPTLPQPGQLQPDVLEPALAQREDLQHEVVQPTSLEPVPSGTGAHIPYQEGETEGETPPPTPAADGPGGAGASYLEGVVVAELLAKGVPRPSPRALHAECRRLALLGWDPDRLRAAVRENDWTGARAGAVVTWLRDMAHPPAPARGLAAVRLAARCPDHPDEPAGRCTQCEAAAVPSPLARSRRAK